MEIRILRYFMEIAREENMTRAAEHLHISQPSLSKEIKRLEEELGHSLFVRTNKSMHLTEEGMLLRKRAEDILAMVDKTAEEFSHFIVILAVFQALQPVEILLCIAFISGICETVHLAAFPCRELILDDLHSCFHVLIRISR